MKRGLVWRIGLTLCVLFATVIFVLPTLVQPRKGSGGEPAALARFLPDAVVNLGLDLMGGMQLTLEVLVQKAVETTLGQLGQDLMSEANSKGILITRPLPMPDGNLEFTLASSAKEAEFKELIAKSFPDFAIIASSPASNGKIKYSIGMTGSARKHYEDLTVDQALSTIRNRIDQFGVAEPDVRRQQGSNRISIQLPGLSDPERAISIINRTAHLEFRIVRDNVNLDSGVIPRGVIVLPMEHKDRNGQVVVSKIAVDEQVALTGDHISNAAPAPDGNGNMMVTLAFDRRGSEIFERITGENEGKMLAIILDGKVHSAPTMKDKISGGKATITGNFTIQQANDLSVVLRAGSLPAPVKELEKRTVGPSLGQEAIDAGIFAACVGGAAVVVFMVLYYGMSGVVADLMLLFDIGLILAGMAAFGATLTMPGIAGIVLTIGMAVDANVLIFERIREELDRGLSTVEAIDAGFSRAMLAITDSNLTTIIAALILYEFGTGPIRGFAVTLIIGILASLFTAVFVSRIIFDVWMSKPGRKLSI